MSEPVQTAPALDADKGDTVEHAGFFGDAVRGVIQEVKHLFDESGHTLRAFVVYLEGVGRVLMSGDTLRKVESDVADDVVNAVEGASAAPSKPAQPSDTPTSIEIPRSAYTDPTVPPATRSVPVDEDQADETAADSNGEQHA